MALSYSINPSSPRDKGKTIVDITLDSAYPSGGYALSNAGLGMLVKPTMIDLDVSTAQGFTPVWDVSNHKLKMFKSGSNSAHSECASADLSSSVVIRAEVTGTPIF